MQMRLLALALAGAGFLAACGGGGGSSSTSSGGTSSTVALSGVASKGLMANADVNVYAVNSDGSIGSTSLASTTTDSQGAYTLTFTGTKDQPYVVRVSAKADGTTTHLDEVNGTQALPAGFAMRSIVTPASSGSVTTSASITPFSEMAVAAAAKAPGGVTAANAEQAVSTVTQLLGFNPITVAAKTVGSAATSDEQKLAVLLTAVSKLADDGALGCGTAADAGAKTQCVVDKLASAASKDSIKLEVAGSGSTVDVSSALSSAVTTVLGDTSLTGSIPAETLTTVVANLGCSGSSCTPAAPGGSATTSPEATAIAATKLLLTQLKSDWLALFAGSSSSVSATQLEANRFKTSMQGIQVPADVMAKDLGALILGAQMYKQAKTGQIGPDRYTMGRGPDLTSTDTPVTTGGYNAIGCTLYTDGTLATPATSSAQVNVIGCRALYYVTRSVSGGVATTTEWRHAFTITPNVDGSFAYTTRARRRTTVGATVTENAALQADGYSGTFTPTLSSGNVTGFAVTGGLPGAFVNGGTAMFNDHHTWSITGTTTDAAGSISVTGSIAPYSDATTQTGTLALVRGTLGRGTVIGSSDLTGVDLDLTWTTANARFEGSFLADQPVLSKTSVDYIPTRLVLRGALSTIASGVTTDIVTGTLTGTVSGYGNYDSNAVADGPDNYYTVGLSFVGTITAPSRPKLEFTIGTTKRSYEADPASATLQYRSFAAGSATPSRVVSATVNRAVSGPGSVVVTEAAAGISLAWTGALNSVDVTHGTATIGTIDRSSRLLTFTDGSSMSLDFGL